MAENCGMCLALSPKYECGWCQSSNRCEVRNQCDGGSTLWLSRNKICPNPGNLTLTPQLGTLEGS